MLILEHFGRLIANMSSPRKWCVSFEPINYIGLSHEAGVDMNWYGVFFSLLILVQFSRLAMNLNESPQKVGCVSFG